MNSEEIKTHKFRLKEAFKLAVEFNTNRVIIFGVKRDPRDKEKNYQHVIDIIGEAAESAERQGFTLMLENEAGYWADTGENTAKIVRDIGSKYLRLILLPQSAPILPYMPPVLVKLLAFIRC